MLLCQHFNCRLNERGDYQMKKTIIFSHKTAFKFYRHLRTNSSEDSFDKTLKKTSLVVPEKHNKILCESANNFVNKFFVEPSPHLLISSKNHRRLSANAVAKSSNLEYPKNSFCKISEGFYMPSPELLFLHMAQQLNFEKLVLAGIELCGCYLLPNNPNEAFNPNIKPVTSVKNIISYLDKIRMLNASPHSINKALLALKYVSNNSFSPLESKIYLMLCGPREIGAYGITGMQFNLKVELSSPASVISAQNYIYPDICNPKTKVSIEYDSKEFHENESQNTRDKLRINALQSDG